MLGGGPPGRALPGEVDGQRDGTGGGEGVRRAGRREPHELTAVEVGHTDTDRTTVLHLPSIRLVVAGDAAYNAVHLHLGESTTHTLRDEWLAALDTIESLNPSAVVAGHKRPERADSPHIVGETRGYIRDFDQIAENTSTAQQLYDQMLALYPARLNRGPLWSSARAVKP